MMKVINKPTAGYFGTCNFRVVSQAWTKAAGTRVAILAALVK